MKVEFFSDGVSIGTVEAKNYRQDLKDNKKGNGEHGYIFFTPSKVKDNINHHISAKVQNSTFTLKGSLIALKCAPSARLSVLTSEIQLEVVVRGNPTSSDEIDVEIRSAEDQPLRLQLIDATGRQVSELQVEQPDVVEHQRLKLGKHPAGVLFLKVTSGSQSITKKVLKQ
ncbi:T9SS type A sorting domain-containing protein [Larkinella rosea]|nr:T9SS type A sorting domain-containing protein [Larkinella rosea]